MFHSRTLNSKTNQLHEKALRILYGDYKSKFDELLEKDSSFSMHHRKIQRLAIMNYSNFWMDCPTKNEWNLSG